MLRLLQLALLPALATSAGLGHIYSVATNGTTNNDNFLDLDLTTWEVSVGPDLGPGFETFGQAAAVVDSVYWLFNLGNRRSALLTGIDVATRAVAYNLDASQWPLGGTYFFEAVFAQADGHSLLVVGSYGSAAPGLLVLYSIAAPKSAAPVVTHLGNVTCPDYCADAAFHAPSGTLYLTSGASDTSSGSLVEVSLSAPGGPAITRTSPLANFFDFKQVAADGGLFGLSLWSAPGGPARNLTRLDSSLAPVDEGAIGDGLYVVLEDGPKAYDAATQRAFYSAWG